MAKTTQWLIGSLPEGVAASVLRVADLLHLSSAGADPLIIRDYVTALPLPAKK